MVYFSTTMALRQILYTKQMSMQYTTVIIHMGQKGNEIDNVQVVLWRKILSQASRSRDKIS